MLIGSFDVPFLSGSCGLIAAVALSAQCGCTSNTEGADAASGGTKSSSGSGENGGSGAGAAAGASSGGSGNGGDGTGGLASGGAPQGGAFSAGGVSNAGGSGGVPKPSGDGEPNLRVIPWNGHRAAVSLTFDDADPTHYQVARPLLDARGIKATFFIVRNTIENIGESAREGFRQLHDAGHEIANHTMSHAGSSAGTASEVSDCDAYIATTFNLEPSTFAYPNVDVTATYKDAAAELYVASRGGGAGEHITIDATPDFHDLPSYFVADTDPGFDLYQPAEVPGAIDETVAAGAYRILTFHGVGPGGFFANTSEDNLESILDYLGTVDAWVDTFARVSSYLRAAKALEAATPASDGTTRTWTWTLPPGFPADVDLRVVVDGGSLSQNGATIVWNASGGYYPVDPRQRVLTWTR